MCVFFIVAVCLNVSLVLTSDGTDGLGINRGGGGGGGIE